MINAPDAVVSLWESEAVRALAAADRATSPDFVSDIARSPGGVIELVASLAAALTRAAGVLAGSVVQATPEGAAVFLAGVDRLARELDGDFSCCGSGDDDCEGGTS